jgi:rfaE bifunctional protein nucleotidyltransferase chain/domain
VDAVISLDEAVTGRAALRREGRRLVFTNGHFDLLHVGHLDYLEKARALGDALYVGLNGDASTRRLKGAGRPLVPAAERARLVAALRPVTAVIIFEDDTADALIRVLQPDIYVKGGDYAHKPLPERPAVEAYGGQIALIDYLPDHSTSDLIARIKHLPLK